MRQGVVNFEWGVRKRLKPHTKVVGGPGKWRHASLSFLLKQRVKVAKTDKLIEEAIRQERRHTT